MKQATPAELHDDLVKAGAEHYSKVYAALMKYMGQGGLTPGLTKPTADELLQLFESTTPEYWLALAKSAPQEAQSQLAQFKKVAP